MISGLKLATSEIILGLSANERGTFWYQGQGKLQEGIDIVRKTNICRNRPLGKVYYASARHCVFEF